MRPFGVVIGPWYGMAVGAGAVLGLGGLAAGHVAMMLVGVGLVLLGLGESLNTPRVARYVQMAEWGLIRRVVVRRIRRPRPFGLVLDGVGIALLGIGLVRLVLG